MSALFPRHWSTKSSECVQCTRRSGRRRWNRGRRPRCTPTSRPACPGEPPAAGWAGWEAAAGSAERPTRRRPAGCSNALFPRCRGARRRPRRCAVSPRAQCPRDTPPCRRRRTTERCSRRRTRPRRGRTRWPHRSTIAPLNCSVLRPRRHGAARTSSARKDTLPSSAHRTIARCPPRRSRNPRRAPRTCACTAPLQDPTARWPRRASGRSASW
mmetsp:Transcript_2243/g.6669  ORF Transcript_2243/g.6669 Transcript_2243/m.6669 type:complete len:213 (-) Transcript_2243:6464-7102(-)